MSWQLGMKLPVQAKARSAFLHLYGMNALAKTVYAEKT